MKRFLKLAVVILFAGFVVLQFFRPDRTNPSGNEADTLAAATTAPDDVSATFTRSCNDCHSNETVYPWYSNVSPFSWFLAGHIEEGRGELNFSEWNTYSPEKKIRKLDEICEMVGSRAMPLSSYLWIHRDAVLSQEEIDTICRWTRLESARIEAAKSH